MIKSQTNNKKKRKKSKLNRKMIILKILKVQVIQRKKNMSNKLKNNWKKNINKKSKNQ